MARNLQGITIEIDGNTTKLQDALRSVERASKKVNTELRDITGLLKFNPDHVVLLGQKQEQLAKKIETTKEKLDLLRRSQDDMVKNGDVGSDKYQNLQREIIEAEGALKHFNSELGKIKAKPIEDLGKKFENAGNKIGAAGDKIAEAGKFLSTRVTAPLVGLGTIATNASVDYEQAFAGVEKTVNATEEQFAQLSDGILGMSKELPASAVDIAGVAEAAGQLGIKTENILDFTRTIIDLQESTNLAGDSGAMMFAQFANVAGMDQRNFSRLGSALVDLGNNGASTEADIMELAQRLVGAGSLAKMSESDILGLAASMSNVGINAEAGGTAMSKLITRMQVAAESGENAQEILEGTGRSLRDLEMLKSHDSQSWGILANKMGLTKQELNKLLDAAVGLEKFSEITGMTSSEFVEGFGEDATGAVAAFVNGLQKIEDSGGSVVVALEDLGINEVRMRDAILRLAGAGEMMASEVERSSRAWEENTALAKEAEKRYETTGSQLSMAKNQMQDAAIALGDILAPKVLEVTEKLSDLIGKFRELDKDTQDMIVKFGAIAAALGPVLFVGGKLTSIFGSIMSYVGSAIGKIGTLAAKYIGLGGSIGSVVAAALPVIAIIGSLVAAFIHLWNTNDEFKATIIATWEKIKSTLTNFIGEIKTRLEEMGPTLDKIKEYFLIFLDFMADVLGPVLTGMFEWISIKFQYVTDTILNIWDLFSAIFTGDFQGVIDALKGFLVSWWEHFSGIVGNILDTIRGIFDVILGLFGTDTETVIQSFKDFWVGIWEGIKSIASTVSDFLIDAWEGIKSAVGAVVDALTGAWNGLKDTTGVVKDALLGAWDSIKGAMGSVKDFIVNAWDTIKNAFTVAGMLIESVFNAIVDIVLVPFTFIWINFGDQIQEVWDKVVGAVSTAAEVVFTYVRDKFEAVRNAVTAVTDAISGKISEVWGAIKTKTSEIWDTIKGTISGVVDSISGKISEVWDGIKTKTSEVWESVKTYVTDRIEAVKTLVSTVMDAISGKVTEIWDGIKTKTSEVWEGIKTTVSGIVESIKNVVTNTFNTAKSNITGVWEALKTVTRRIWDSIKSSILDRVTLVKDSVYGHFDRLKTRIKTIWDNIKTSITTPLTNAWNKVKEIIEKIKNAFDFDLSFPSVKMPHFSIQGSFSLKPPSVPRLAIDWYDKGGIFTGPSIIGVGEKRPEFVGALDDLKAIVAEVIHKESPQPAIVNKFEINGLTVREDADIDRIADLLYRKMQRGQRGFA